MDVSLAGTDGDGPVHQRAERNLVHEAAVDTGDGDDSAIAAGENGLTQSDWPVRFQHQALLDLVISAHQAGSVRLHARGIDTRIRSTPARNFLERREYIHFFIIEGFGARLLASHAQPFREAVDGNHTLGAK